MHKLLKLLSFILTLCLLVTCVHCTANAETSVSNSLENEIEKELNAALGTDQYIIDADTEYLSKEDLEELQFCYRKTSYFGCLLADIDEQFNGEKWYFTTDENGETVAVSFEAYDDTYDVALRNLAIGTGVILICVTVSLASGGLGAPAVSAIFAASAKGATIGALSSGTINGVVSGVKTAIDTQGDMDAVLKAAAKAGSSGFLCGSITGAVFSGVTEAVTLHHGTANGLSMNEVAQIQKETKWSTETISKIKNMKEYSVYKDLQEVTINGEKCLIPKNIKLDYTSELAGKTVTNLERMQSGAAAIDPATNLPYHIHHVNQEVNGVKAFLTQTQHMGNDAVLHVNGAESVHATIGALWNTERAQLWKGAAAILGGK